MEFEEIGSMLWKIGVFAVVQVLVYLILTQSSGLFSNSKLDPRSHAFALRPVSIQRWAAALADVPAGSADSPSASSSSPNKRSTFLQSLSFSRITDQPS